MDKNFLDQNVVFYTLNKAIKISQISKINLIFIVIGFILVSFLEALSIGSIYPVIKSITNNEIPSNLLFIQNLFGDQNLIVTTLSIFCILFFFKNLIILIYSWFSGKIIYESQKKLIDSIYEMYLFEELSNHLKRNKAEVIRDINLGKTLCRTLDIILILFTEILTVFFLIVLIFLTIDFKIFISIFIFLISFLIIFNFLRKKLKKWGKQNTRLLSKLIQNMNESFSGIKDIKVFRKESFFLNKFVDFNNQFTNIAFKKSIADKLPKVVMETGVIFGITILLFFLFIIRENNISTTLPLLGMLSLIIVRMMPATIKIIGTINTASYILFQTKRLNDAFDKFSDYKNNKNKITKEINLHQNKFEDLKLVNINFKYNNDNNQLNFNDINLNVKRNEFIGIKGESGSGKTTLLNIILGLYKPTAGAIIINNNYNKNIYNNFNISFVFQTQFLIDDTFRANICFGDNNKSFDKKKFLEIVEKTELKKLMESKIDKEEFMIGENGNLLSQGQKQRILIARALYTEPEILVLDEPTSSLDNATEDKIIDIINKLKGSKTIFLVSHNLKNLEKCDKIITVENNRINIIKNL